MQSSNSIPPLWRRVQRDNFTNIEQLLDFLELEAANRLKIDYSPKFPLNLPKRLAAKIKKNSIDDPIFRQFVPLIEEKVIFPGYKVDPVQDESFRKEKKILHKYQGRVLFLATSACAMNCRYCFRQNFSYDTSSEIVKELEYLATESEIEEVILSGGDPLSLSDAVLFSILKKIEAIPHIKRVRFHTRFLIGIPERIDESFIQHLSSLSKQVYFVIHTNHSQELDEEVFKATREIARLGIPLLNSSVLLRGVNDSVEALVSLFLSLSNHGVIPYYLNLLDPVVGASHFDVPENKAIELMKKVQSKVSGYSLPRLIREEAGKQSKTIRF
jgi:EF-P beta-lysylation protein EpmB